MKAIAVGADDAAVHLKGVIAQYLKHRGIPVHDYGIFDDETVLYPDIALAVAQAVAEGKHDKGILLCGTGIGVSITANKVPGICAAVCHDLYSTERPRMSNDCQIMAFGSQVVGEELAKSLVDLVEIGISSRTIYTESRTDQRDRAIVKQDETVGLRTSALRKDGRRTVSLSSTQSSAGKNQLTRLVSLSLGGGFRPTGQLELTPINRFASLHLKNAATLPPSTVVTSPVVFSASA